MMRSQLYIATVLGMIVAAPLPAQQHGHGATDSTAGAGPMAMVGMGSCMMMSGTEGHFMMQVMRLTPGTVLRHAEALGLSERQVSQLEAFAEPSVPMAQRRERMRVLMENLQRAFDADPSDPGAVERAAEALVAMHSQMQLRHVTDAAAVRDILTPAQRERLTTLTPMPMDAGMMGHGEGAGMMGGRHRAPGNR